MAYCYQTIPLLINSGSVAIVLQPLLSVFALKTSNGSGDGMCFIEGMNAMGKLLIPLMGPLFLMTVACVLLLVSTLRARLASTQDAAIEGRFLSIAWTACKLKQVVCDRTRSRQHDLERHAVVGFVVCIFTSFTGDL